MITHTFDPDNFKPENAYNDGFLAIVFEIDMECPWVDGTNEWAAWMNGSEAGSLYLREVNSIAPKVN